MEGRTFEGRWVVALAIAAAVWLALFPITSVDAYYHLAVGKRILEDRAIPSRGVGSATFGNEPWHDNEWGFQVLAALAGRTARDADGVLVLTPRGRASLVLLRGAFLALALVFVSTALDRRGVPPLLRSVALWLVAFLTFGNLFWDIRPQIVSYAIFAALLWLLEEDRRGRRIAVPAILAATAAWSNFHAAFPVGGILVAVDAAGELWDGRRDPRARKRGVRLALTAAAMPLAAACNPHGFEQVIHPLRYVLQPEIHAGNVDWMPPDFLRLPLLGLTFAWAVASWWGCRTRRAADALRIVAFSALLATALRHLPFTAMVLAVAAAPLATAAAAARRGGWRAWLEPVAWVGGDSPLRRWAVAGLLAVAIAGLSGAKFIGPLPRFEEAPVRPMPERAVRFLSREGVEGSGFNAYRFGGFLMFRLYPEERVFMDGRNDLYGTFRQDVYNPTLRAEAGWERRLDDAVARWNLGWILVDAADPIALALASHPGWIRGTPAVVDGNSEEGIVLYLRDTPANRERLPRWPRA